MLSTLSHMQFAGSGTVRTRSEAVGKRGKSKKPRGFWTERELKVVRKLYRNHRTREIAELLDRTVLSIYQAADKLGLKKSREFLRSEESGWGFKKGSEAGKAYRFQKGVVPANKGLRRPGYQAGRMKETQFKKGCRSGKAAENWKPIGTILADTEGYLRIKVREATHGKEATGFGNTKVWPLLNRHIWEQHHGPIPPKHMVVFKDRNRANCVIENLELMSMADNARRNSIWTQLPRELAKTIQLNGALKRVIRRLNGKEQDQRSQRPPVRDAGSFEGHGKTDGSRPRQGDQRSGADDHQHGHG
jgi:hypothetical protein